MNSDPNSNLNSALHQARSCALRAHGVRSRAHTPNSRAQRVHVVRMLGVHWSRHAQVACPRSRPHFDIATSRKPESCRNIESMSRHHSDYFRSRPQNGVATSFLLPSSKPGRDIKTRSRPQNGVATSFLLPSSKPGHDIKTRSRPLLETNLCRDISFMSRPHSYPQWDFQACAGRQACTGHLRRGDVILPPYI